MKPFLTILLIICSLQSLSQTHEKDSIALLKLTQSFYKWELTKSKFTDFDPLQIDEKDTLYPRLDGSAFEKRFNELESTGYFTNGFLENYAGLFELINSKIASGELFWYTGELPPFGNDANPWCNCQDEPYDQASWTHIRIKGLEIHENTADFYWSWAADQLYHMKAQKEGKKWKIDYMEGLDPTFFLQRIDVIR